MSPNSMMFNEYMGEKVKGFYTSKKYSDVVVKIREEGAVEHPEDVQSSGSTDVHSKVFKCHKLVLHINSPYFEEVLEKEGEEVDELEVKVKDGELRYMEIMLSFFYNEDVIRDFNLIDLISFLELSVTYARSHHHKAIVELIEKLDPDFNSSTLGLQKLYSIDKDFPHNISEDLKLSLKQKFSTYLAKYFAPIELNQEKHEILLGLEYSSFLYLLEGNEPIAISENSLLVLINEWLDYDTSRQTSHNIMKLLANIRLKHTSGKFLHWGIGYKHVIFNKWDGYKEWLCDAFGFLFLSPEQQNMTSLNNLPCRSIPGGTHAWFKDNVNKNLNAIRWKVHMTTVDKGKKLEPTRHLLIHDGMKFSPKSITITPIEGDDSKSNMSLQITSSYSMFGVRFVVGIVPANMEHDISDKYFHSRFAQAFLKWTDPVDVETNSLELDYWTIREDMVKISDEYGLFVFLLPLTDNEFQVLKDTSFLANCNDEYGCANCDTEYGCQLYSPVVGANKCSSDHDCSRGHTFSGEKIYLYSSNSGFI